MHELKEIPLGMPGWGKVANEYFAIMQNAINDLEKKGCMETGTATLTNTLDYPFSNSEQTIALKAPRNNLNYLILAEIIDASGSAELLPPYGKQLNGFKLAFVGNAASVTVRYYVQGGMGE